jgi:hypothetical protein
MRFGLHLVQFACHPEQADVAQRRTWAIRAKHRVAFIKKAAMQYRATGSPPLSPPEPHPVTATQNADAKIPVASSIVFPILSRPFPPKTILVG